MSEIPLEIAMHAERLYDEGGYESVPTIIAKAIIAERERCAEAVPMDDPATTVYGRLLFRHMQEARKDFDGDDRHRIYALIQAFESEFPDQCAVWNDRYSTKEAP